MAGNSDSDEDKNLAPTQRRLDQAREKGQVPRSRELSGTLATFAAVCVLVFGAASMFINAEDWMRAAFSAGGSMVAGARDDVLMLDNFYALTMSALLTIAPIMVAAMVAGVAGSVGLGGLLLSGESLIPKFSRLSPMAGLGRIFSMQGLGELGKSLLKVAVLGGLAAFLFWRGTAERVNLMAGSHPESIMALGVMLRYEILVMAAGLFIIAAADIPLQWWNHYKQMRMSLQEVKQEHKDTDGDPHVKGKIRQMQRERARSRMMQAIPTADVVVTNPTHYAVALKYEEGKATAPLMVAKGTDEVAARIRELAREHRIPILESPELARALHRHGELEQEIPAGLFRAVAQVLAHVYQIRAPGGNSYWQPVEVPAGWDPLGPNPLGRGGRATKPAEGARA